LTSVELSKVPGSPIIGGGCTRAWAISAPSSTKRRRMPLSKLSSESGADHFRGNHVIEFGDESDPEFVVGTAAGSAVTFISR
jgi:hypothetical protein